MAYKRMFNKEITNSDVFLDMPLSSQALYFHLGMNSDDDGFVNPKSILRLVGAKEDDLGVLILRGFVIQFLDGILVITHRKRNNNIRSDRYTPTIYKEHLKILKIEENIYKKDNSELQCIPVVGQVVYPDIDIGIGIDTDIGIVTGKEKNSSYKEDNYSKELDILIERWNSINSIGKAKGLPSTIKKTKDLISVRKKARDEFELNDIITAINNYCLSIEKRKKKDENDTFYEHRRTLYEFLVRKNGLQVFINK